MTSRAEHFKNQVDMLGVSQQVHANKDQSFVQYLSEDRWANSDLSAAKKISAQGAKDLVGEALHHSAMDEIQGIDEVRKTFNPQRHVSLTADLPSGTLGYLKTDMSGRQNMLLSHKPDQPLRTHVVTHETAHLLTHPALQGMQWANLNNANGIGHSWAMARMHVHVVRNTLGSEAADNLRSIYRAYGVGFGRRNI